MHVLKFRFLEFLKSLTFFEPLKDDPATVQISVFQIETPLECLKNRPVY